MDYRAERCPIALIGRATISLDQPPNIPLGLQRPSLASSSAVMLFLQLFPTPMP